MFIENGIAGGFNNVIDMEFVMDRRTALLEQCLMNIEMVFPMMKVCYVLTLSSSGNERKKKERKRKMKRNSSYEESQ